MNDCFTRFRLASCIRPTALFATSCFDRDNSQFTLKHSPSLGDPPMMRKISLYLLRNSFKGKSITIFFASSSAQMCSCNKSITIFFVSLPPQMCSCSGCDSVMVSCYMKSTCGMRRVFLLAVALFVAASSSVVLADDTANTLLQRALYFSDLYNWRAARPYFTKSQQMFEAAGDRRNA